MLEVKIAELLACAEAAGLEVEVTIKIQKLVGRMTVPATVTYATEPSKVAVKTPKVKAKPVPEVIRETPKASIPQESIFANADAVLAAQAQLEAKPVTDADLMIALTSCAEVTGTLIPRAILDRYNVKKAVDVPADKRREVIDMLNSSKETFNLVPQ